MSHVARQPGGAPSSEPGLGEKWRLVRTGSRLVTKCNNVTGAGEGWEDPAAAALSSQSAGGLCTGSCSLTMSLVSSSADHASDQDILDTSVQQQYLRCIPRWLIVTNNVSLFDWFGSCDNCGCDGDVSLFWVNQELSCDDKNSGHLTLDLRDSELGAVTRRMSVWLLTCKKTKLHRVLII